MKTVRIGLDVGGTFTDVVAVSDDGRLVHQKRRSQPDDPARSVHRCISDALADLGASPDTVRFLGHGTTIVTNLIIEGAGDPVALMTTAGFRDVLDLGRQARPRVYDYRVARPASPAQRRDRFEVPERAGPEGAITPLDDAVLQAVADTLAERGARAVAVCFLHSYRHPGHERQAVALLRARLPGAYVTASHDVAPEYREFERFSTTALNASVGPRAIAYLTRLEAGLRAEGLACPLHTVTSNAGLVDPDTVRRMPVRTALSGPAAGVAGIGRMLSQEGFGDLITFDMGGTSTDIAVLRQGAPGQARTREVAGHPILAPMVDIDVIGAGGGSLVRVDAGGALSVGPESAGAEPGPAAYGRGGTRATVTDAAATLGLVGGGRALGGVLTLDRAAAEVALARDVAVPLDLSLVAAADGVMAVAGASIARAVRSAAVRRGIDPAGATLVAFGGAGPMLATRVADSLGIARIAVPAAPGTLCARAILVSDLARDFSVTHPLELTEAAGPGLAAAFATLEAEGRAWLAG
ncbi:MAG: hydantoinase/oxoprolinase family protein, partial [Pseudomonadota bacterium]